MHVSPAVPVKTYNFDKSIPKTVPDPELSIFPSPCTRLYVSPLALGIHVASTVELPIYPTDDVLALGKCIDISVGNILVAEIGVAVGPAAIVTVIFFLFIVLNPILSP
jgi:hypothetical protein